MTAYEYRILKDRRDFQAWMAAQPAQVEHEKRLSAWARPGTFLSPMGMDEHFEGRRIVEQPMTEQEWQERMREQGI